MTSFQVPTYQAPGQSWRLVDYRPAVILTATADATGVATATGPQVDPGYMWAIQRAVCSSTSTAQSRLRIYEGSPAVGNLLTGSGSGNYDEADYPLGLLVSQSRELVAVWSGADPGSACTLRLQVAVLGLG